MKDEKDYTIEELKSFHKNILTDEVICKLEEGFKNDFTIHEACNYAGLSQRTFYNYMKSSTEFAEKMRRSKSFIFIQAKKIIANAILKERSIKEAKWLLDRRQKSLYSTNPQFQVDKPETEDDSQKTLNVIRNIADTLNKLHNNQG